MSPKIVLVIKTIIFSLLVFVFTGGLAYYMFLKYSHKSPAAEFTTSPNSQNESIPLSESFSTPQSSSLPSYFGYIVRLQNPAVADYTSSLQDANSPQSQISQSASNYVAVLTRQHNQVRSDLRTKLGRDTIQKEYFYTLNGFYLNLTDQEAEKIKSSSYVKNVSKNIVAHATLMNSVPLIGADRVWSLSDSAGRRITGRGTRIAIIDTGIDYTHSDLGQTPIIDRVFQKIPTDNLRLISSPNNIISQSIAYDGRYLAYLNKASISIYDTATGQTERITPYIPGSELVRLAVQADKLMYYSTDLNNKNPGIYYYNRTSKLHKKIAASSTISSLSVEGNFLVYNRGDFEANLGRTSLYAYDVSTNVEFKIADNIYTHAVSQNRVAFAQNKKIVLYDLLTRQKIRELSTSDAGDILDFKGNYIVYSDCSLSCGNYYSLYDLSSNSITRIFSSQPIGGAIKHEVSVQAGVPIVIGSTLLEASIGDGVIFLRKSYRDPKVMMYDFQSKRTVQMNIVSPAYDFVGFGKKTCFLSSDVKLYCHTYDPSYSYPQPSQIFNKKVVGGYDFVNNDNDPLDDLGHGTHVAAIAAGNNELKGVAPSADLVGYKVLDYTGSGFFSDIISALERVVQTQTDADAANDIDIANLSLGADCKAYGGYSFDCGPDDPLSQAVDSAMSGGVSVVVAAGNAGDLGVGSIGSPGTSRKAITVGSVDKQKQLSYFSSRGPVVWNGETIIKPDVVAPGQSICAAQWGSWLNSILCLNRNHISISGTSMATPHVAGVASLLNQKFPSIRPSRLKTRIKSTAVNLGYDSNRQGAGLVDSYGAVTK